MQPSTPLFIHHQIVVDPGQAPCRLDKLLVNRLASSTRTQLQAAIKHGNVLVEGMPTKASHQVKPHQVIDIKLPTSAPPTDVIPENIPLDIVYEDSVLLVVNKPALMVVHPAHANWSGTLVNALLHHCKDLPTTPQNEGRPGLVHRIDKGTSGLLVIGKTTQSLARLGKQFFDHSIERKYIGLVWGTPEQEQGTVHVALRRSKSDRRLMAPCKELEGKDAITHYKVIKQLQYVSLVEFVLETGRTHQIRAHMKHIGHPLFGDSYYGGDRVVKGPLFSKYKAFVQNCFTLLPYQALHATSLGFIHPTTKEKMFFEVQVPANFTKVIEKWERKLKANNFLF